MRIAKFRVHAMDLPFKKPFKHAAAERLTSDSILLECETDNGTIGFGECLPRSYVTGEDRDGAFAMLCDQILPKLIGRDLSSLDETLNFLDTCDGRPPEDWVAPDQPACAAWSAVDLALLDASARHANKPLRLTDFTEPPRDLRYSVVLSSHAGWRTLLLTRLVAVGQVKLKVEAGEKVQGTERTRKWLGSGCDIRADANMAWDADQALAAMKAMAPLGVHSYEQPLSAENIDGMARLVRESGQGVMADESLTDRSSMVRLLEEKACTAVNVRISKCGGLVAALKRCRGALEAGLVVQIGCQVGETSLLSAAHLILVTAVRQVTYAEGCFGKLLLREDPAMPLLQFGFAGRPPKMPTGPGLGIELDRETMKRWTAQDAVVS